jgi:hypothetical protein
MVMIKPSNRHLDTLSSPVLARVVRVLVATVVAMLTELHGLE